GLVFHRIISIDENYMFAIEQRVENNTGEAVTLYPYGLISRHGTPETTGFYILHEGPIGVLNDKLQEIDYDDLEDGDTPSYTSTGGWLGITDKFWLTALIPDQATEVKTRFSYAPQGARYQTDYLNQQGVTVPAGETAGIPTGSLPAPRKSPFWTPMKSSITLPASILPSIGAGSTS